MGMWRREGFLWRESEWCESPVSGTVEPASELCVIEAWRVFPALTGIERTADVLLTGVVPPKSFGPLYGIWMAYFFEKKEIYHGKRKEISTGHHVYG